MNNFTLDDLAAFSRQEKDSFRKLFKNSEMVEMPKVEFEPSDESVKRILSYSRALSVRKSTKLKHVSLVLN